MTVWATISMDHLYPSTHVLPPLGTTGSEDGPLVATLPHSIEKKGGGQDLKVSYSDFTLSKDFFRFIFLPNLRDSCFSPPRYSFLLKQSVQWPWRWRKLRGAAQWNGPPGSTLKNGGRWNCTRPPRLMISHANCNGAKGWGNRSQNNILWWLFNDNQMIKIPVWESNNQ